VKPGKLTILHEDDEGVTTVIRVPKAAFITLETEAPPPSQGFYPLLSNLQPQPVPTYILRFKPQAFDDSGKYLLLQTLQP
jgi:hypothetical protein